jgi:hypothetical protein
LVYLSSPIQYYEAIEKYFVLWTVIFMNLLLIIASTSEVIIFYYIGEYFELTYKIVKVVTQWK